MNNLPSADQIPLPAPVWLLKGLHDVTFSLHLASVGLLIGGLILALIFAVLGRMRQSPAMSQTSGMMIHRLPVVMAFVINFGIPPLLFSQILYGRAFYTSSVLIGAYWIAVILLLMASYYGLYYAAGRAERRKPWSASGLAALILILAIAFIYSNNMTLMLRPQAWGAMYLHSAAGLQLNTADPTLMPRWLFFMAGSFPAAGAALMLMSLRAGIGDDVARFMSRSGGLILAVTIVIQAALAQMAVAAQPKSVMSAVMGDSLYHNFANGWLASALLLALLGLAAAAVKRASALLAILASTFVLLNVVSAVMVRDGIRDITLRAAGFDVWSQPVAANWSVIDMFLVLLVAAVFAIAWLATVAGKAKRPGGKQESYV